ncbi:MAG TPA: PCRF domain-containing protein [Chroococcales cyanobacterium]
MDIHAGEGGEDSRLFARDLLKAYLKYAGTLGLHSELVYESESAWSVRIQGEGAWDALKQEAGKHVVQRVPPTESRGRRHTSAVSVAVLPLVPAESNSLPLHEVEITTQRGHGSGGQNQNKVESAVRAVHKPSGISVFINGRDQYRNKQLALEILAARLSESERERSQRAFSQAKFQQVGFGGRSGKIRTYNFIDSFVLDHRSGIKTHRIEEVMKGKFNLLR